MQYANKRTHKYGPWVYEKLMGRGAFGEVILWKNEQTGQSICIKECHCLELAERQKSQWKRECSIMLSLRHPNVVRGLQTPPELDPGGSDVPVLAMEYCYGGDLRKVLNKAQNCCGLQELQVRAVTRDISLAIEYLHGKQIVHRDLKPENIVLKPLSNDKFQYKLIDLGYAKDISAGSICKSFVGTEQYLAPELFVSASDPGRPYDCNVDYWCLGTTVFECIVGFRPFFHGIPAVQWLRHVSEKRPEQICGILNIDGDVVFSESIPTPNSLCRHSQQLFEQWLRLMLMYDANSRGGGTRQDGRSVCFHLLEKILKGRVMNIYSVLSNRVLAYPVDQDTQVLTVMTLIQQDTRIPVQEQEILSSAGNVILDDKIAVHCLGHADEENLFFLFPQSSCQFTYQKKTQPELVQFLVSHSRGRQIPYDILKRAYSHCVYYVTELNSDYSRLLQAQRAANVYLMRKKSDLAKERKEMSSMVLDLKSKIQFFKESLQLDIDKLENQKNSGIYSEKMVNFWHQTLEEVTRFIPREDEANQINRQIDRLDVSILDINKLPQGKGRNENFGVPWEKRAMEIYDKFRKTPKEGRNVTHNYSDMVKCVVDFMTENSRQVQDLYGNIQKILDCKAEVVQLLPRIIELQNRLQAAQDKVLKFQKRRQNDIWGLFKEVVKTVSPLSQGVLATGEMPPVPPSLATTHSAMPPPPSPQLAPPPGGTTGSICHSSMLIEKSTEESMNLRQESLSSLQQIQQTVTSIQASIKAATTLPNWDFLNQDDDPMEDEDL